MGYSQIYVRINDEFGRKFLLAKHFSLNMQEEMVSRAKGIIEYLYDNREYASILMQYGHFEELGRIIEINWDYHSVEISKDIIQGFIDNNNKASFKEFVFDNQENTDGQLFIDMQCDYKHKKKNGDPTCFIKYGFFIHYIEDNKEHGTNKRIIYGPDEYMQQDFARLNQAEWRTRPLFQHCLKFTERNISYIEKHADKMMDEDVLEFMEYDYTKDLSAYYKV